MVSMAVILALLMGLCGTVQTASDQPQPGGCIGRDASCPLSEEKSAFIEKHGGTSSAAHLQAALGEAKRIAQAAHTASGKALTASGHAVTAIEHMATTMQGLANTDALFGCEVVFKPEEPIEKTEEQLAPWGLDFTIIFDIYRYWSMSGQGYHGYMSACGKGKVCVVNKAYVDTDNDKWPTKAIGKGTCKSEDDAKSVCAKELLHTLAEGDGHFCMTANPKITVKDLCRKPPCMVDLKVKGLGVRYSPPAEKGSMLNQIFTVSFPGDKDFKLPSER